MLEAHIGMVQPTCRRTNVRGRYDRGCTYVLEAHIGMAQPTCLLTNVRGRYPIIKKGIDTKVSIPFFGKYLVLKLYGCCGSP